MRLMRPSRPLMLVVIGTAWITAGCERNDQPATRPTEQAVPRAPADEPPTQDAPERMAAPPRRPDGEPSQTNGTRLALEGISFAVPDGWESEVIEPGPFAARAAFKLARAEGDEEDPSVRITHYPNMRGMNDANIDRWLGQMTRPDGTPYTRDNADIQRSTLSGVQLTVVDITGTLSSGMAGGGPTVSGQRMIAAILDHPKGLHFVRVTGPIQTIAKWEDSIQEFLNSVQVQR